MAKKKKTKPNKESAKEPKLIEDIRPQEPAEVVEVAEPVVKKEVGKKIVVKDMDQPANGWEHLVHDKKLMAMVSMILALLVITGVAALAWKYKQPTNANASATEKRQSGKNAEKKAPTILPRHLDGLLVAAADANAVPACVMIENAAFDGVRPQSGLSAASVVYEVIVEGGITRLMAVYGGEAADEVGPVRSARDTYLEFASEYNCAYVHAGGSYTAMQAIQNFELRDVDALYEGTWFWRDSSKYSPHNLFTNTENLYEAIADGHSWKDEPTYATWNFVDDADLPVGEPATEVNIEFGGSYNVTYTYNLTAKYYERSNGGILQVDANNNRTLTTRNVIVQHVPPGDYIEGKGRVNFSVTGEGVVEIFRNGVVTTGTWKKANRLDRTRFYDAAGVEIALVRGNTWVEIVPEGYTFNWE